MYGLKLGASQQSFTSLSPWPVVLLEAINMIELTLLIIGLLFYLTIDTMKQS
jgi:hypothetical protein